MKDNEDEIVARLCWETELVVTGDRIGDHFVVTLHNYYREEPKNENNSKTSDLSWWGCVWRFLLQYSK